MFDLTNLCATYCRVAGVAPPKDAGAPVETLCRVLTDKTSDGYADRVLLYNPDAIGSWIYETYYEIFAPMRAAEMQELNLSSVFPPKTPVCFASIYSGLYPEAHGITKYTKPVLTVDTMFDAFIRAGKKPCIVCVKNQSMDKIFRGRAMDYYSEDNDGKVVERALELIAKDEYDLICVYNQAYDDSIHRTHPRSRRSVRALKSYAAAFDALSTAVRQNWRTHDTLIGSATDHGVHREWYLLGNHGKNIPKDMSIIHHYGIIPKSL